MTDLIAQFRELIILRDVAMYQRSAPKIKVVTHSFHPPDPNLEAITFKIAYYLGFHAELPNFPGLIEPGDFYYDWLGGRLLQCTDALGTTESVEGGKVYPHPKYPEFVVFLTDSAATYCAKQDRQARNRIVRRVDFWVSIQHLKCFESIYLQYKVSAINI